MDLEPNQVELLGLLVDVERRTPPSERYPFLVRRIVDGPSLDIVHPALHERLRASHADIDTLAEMGLLKYAVVEGTRGFYVTNRGLRLHDSLIAAKGDSYQRMQAVVREYLISDDFCRRYPTASEKWRQAEALLWDTDATAKATNVGHFLREGMQEFATALVERFKPEPVEPDKAKTVNRMRAVLGMQRHVLGRTDLLVLRAVAKYWEAVDKLAQRQEHGAQREGIPLGWHDSRRAVFQVAMVMFEIDSALLAAPRPDR